MKIRYQKNTKIGLLILGMLLICGLGASLFSYSKRGASPDRLYLAVIPHFMIRSQRVSDFYSFLQKKYFATNSPDQIVLISPNHFFPDMQRPVSICKSREVKFKDATLLAQARKDERITCEQNVFYQQGAQRYTRDHGLGVHFPFINRYFPSVSKVFILVVPSYRLYHSGWIANQLAQFHGNTLVIGSVDFSHYKSEDIADQNDQISFSLLSQTGVIERLRNLDVDCPACLGVLDTLAQKQGQRIHQRLRDSSSTILGKDMKEENTSRQFLWRE